MYLLRIAATEVMATTYQGSCARSTIATIMAVSTAPLGNSQAFFLTRRISASTRPAAIAALASPAHRADALARRGHATKHHKNDREQALRRFEKFLGLYAAWHRPRVS